jgi:hypothetical protein
MTVEIPPVFQNPGGCVPCRLAHNKSSSLRASAACNGGLALELHSNFFDRTPLLHPGMLKIGAQLRQPSRRTRGFLHPWGVQVKIIICGIPRPSRVASGPNMRISREESQKTLNSGPERICVRQILENAFRNISLTQ